MIAHNCKKRNKMFIMIEYFRTNMDLAFLLCHQTIVFLPSVRYFINSCLIFSHSITVCRNVRLTKIAKPTKDLQKNGLRNISVFRIYFRPRHFFVLDW